MMYYKTPRGNLPVSEIFVNRKQAKQAGYGYYFTHGNTDIFTKHTSEYSCKFAIINKK